MLAHPTAAGRNIGVEVPRRRALRHGAMNETPDDATAQEHQQGGGNVGRSRSAIRRGVGPHLTVAAVLTVGLLVMVAATWLFSIVYAAVTDDQSVARLDEPALALAMHVRSPWLDSALTVFTNTGGTVGLPILGGVTIVVLCWKSHAWTPIVLGVTAGGGSLLMTIAGKDFFGRDRPPRADAVPPYETSTSFPSGHTLNATVVFGIIAYVLIVHQSRRALRTVTITSAAVLAVAIGLSRVYLGHHWLTDVLAAWFLALAWLAVIITAHRLWLRLYNATPPRDSPRPPQRASHSR